VFQTRGKNRQTDDATRACIKWTFTIDKAGAKMGARLFPAGPISGAPTSKSPNRHAGLLA
jgi:hypothetical protein